MNPGVTVAAGLVQPWASPPSVADVERITALADPVVRNLQITQCYHELSLALGTRTGNHANWCTFAVWASKQAGQTIRKEDLARALEQLWDTSSEVSVVTPSPPSLRHPVATSVSTARSRRSRRAAARSAIAALSHGGPLHDRADYRRRIRDVVMATSSFERASKATSRGNWKVFAEIARQFARFLATFETDTVFDAAKISAFCAEFRPGEPPNGQRYLVLAGVHQLLPSERLDAGKDLRAEFPAALAHLVNAELLALLDLVDPTPDSLQETAAADWSMLPDRMHFIADMFRCFQERSDLLSPPFSPEQVAILKDGRRPAGRL